MDINLVNSKKGCAGAPKGEAVEVSITALYRKFYRQG
jgi:hypothetical protein